MHVQFKSVGNKSYSFDVNEDDEISSIVSQLATTLDTDLTKSSFRVIFEGKILEHTKKFIEFKDTKSPFIFVVLKNKVETNTSTTNIVQPIQSAPASTVQLQQAPAPTVQLQQAPAPNQSIFSQPETDTNTNTKLDDVDKLRASVIAVLFFIRSNPQLAELFINNFESLLGVLSSNQVKPLFEKIISDSESDNNDSEFTDELTDYLSNIQMNEINNNDSNKTDQPINLSEEDMANIEILVSMGFSKNSCVQAYLVSNKNLDMAATFLMDN